MVLGTVARHAIPPRGSRSESRQRHECRRTRRALRPNPSSIEINKVLGFCVSASGFPAANSTGAKFWTSVGFRYPDWARIRICAPSPPKSGCVRSCFQDSAPGSARRAVRVSGSWELARRLGSTTKRGPNFRRRPSAPLHR